jgi:hypothetical protein
MPSVRPEFRYVLKDDLSNPSSGKAANALDGRDLDLFSRQTELSMTLGCCQKAILLGSGADIS